MLSQDKLLAQSARVVSQDNGHDSCPPVGLCPQTLGLASIMKHKVEEAMNMAPQ